jgi:spore germination cell wall hydrolase CwlJ-like protein
MRWLLTIGSFCSAVGISTAALSEGALDEVVTAERVAVKNLSRGPFSRIADDPKPLTPVSYTRRWLAKQPTAPGEADWTCLSQALYFEARGESVKGQFAVAEVIINRVKSSRFPDTVCGVIRQGTGRKYQCQFTYTCDGNSEKIREPGAYRNVGKVARAVLDGRAAPITNGATHYHTTAVRPRWSRVYSKTARYGVHIFYRHTYREAKK